VGKVEHRVEELVSCAHSKQNFSIGVVEFHPVVSSWINKLVTCGALQKTCMDVKPMTGDINCHGELEEKHEAGIKAGQGGQQAHGGASVRQHV